jgi:hypothetical protein
LGKVDKNVGDFFNFPFVNKMLIKENWGGYHENN